MPPTNANKLRMVDALRHYFEGPLKPGKSGDADLDRLSPEEILGDRPGRVLALLTEVGGRWQGMLATGAGVFADRPQQTAIPTATFELAVRCGVGDDTDVGVKLYTAGIEASVRHRLTRGTWSWALLGSLGGARTNADSPTGDAALTQLRFGAVATVRRSSTWAWNLGPTTAFSLWRPAGGGTAGGALVGVFAGGIHSITSHFLPRHPTGMVGAVVDRNLADRCAMNISSLFYRACRLIHSPLYKQIS